MLFHHTCHGTLSACHGCSADRSGQDFWDSVKKDAQNPDFDFVPLFNFAFDNRRNNLFKISIVPGRSRLQAFEAATRLVMTPEQLSAPLLAALPCFLDDRGGQLEVAAADMLHHKSRLLDEGMARRLHSFLLPAANMEGFERMFATSEHGWDLHSLYHKASRWRAEQSRPAALTC